MVSQNIELSYYPEILLLGMYLKEWKAGTWIDICILMFIAALSTIAKRQKQPKGPSTDELKKKKADSNNGLLFGHKKEWDFDVYYHMTRSWKHYS